MTTLRDALATLSGQAGSPAPAGSSTLTHLECTYCDQRYDADQLQTVCTSCGKVLYARYDLARARHTLTRESLGRRRWDMWRYQEVLPVRDPANMVSLGEGMTPLVPARGPARRSGLAGLLLKDEGKNPTGSFKARGLGLRRLAGEGAWREGDCAALGGQRGLGGVGVRRGGRPGSQRLHAARRAGRQPHRVPGVRRAGHPGRRPHQRRRREGPRAGAAAWLVRRLDPQGAVPAGGEEDDGVRAGRAARLDPAGRHHLPDRRRHRHRRDVEGVRRDGGAGPDRLGSAEDGGGAGRGLRADRAGVRAAASVTPSCGRTPRRQRPACGCRWRSATT